MHPAEVVAPQRLGDVPEAERFEVREIEAADRPRDVAECVRECVVLAILRCVRQVLAPTASSTITHARGMELLKLCPWKRLRVSSASSSSPSVWSRWQPP